MLSRLSPAYQTQPNLRTDRGRLPATYGVHHRVDAEASRRADYVVASPPPGFGQQRPNPLPCIASPSTMDCGQNFGHQLKQSTAHSLATVQPSATVSSGPYEAIPAVDHESERRGRGAIRDNSLPGSTADGSRAAEPHDDESGRSTGSSQATPQGPRARQELNSMTASSGRVHPVDGVVDRRHELKACATCGRSRYWKSLDSLVCAYCERNVPDAESR